VADKKSEKFKRYYEIQELRAAEPGEDGKYIIDGYAIVYEQRTNVGDYFQEIIKRGALDGADMTDVPLFIHHNGRKIPLARSRNNNGNSTMTLTPDEKGLYFEAELDVENNVEAKALYSSIKREDISGMSFSFRVDEEKWTDLDTDLPTREIYKFAKIYEISALWSPQYEGTNINARDGELDSSDKEALESAKSTLDSEKREQDSTTLLEMERLKAQILMRG
jgi:uncharacterized protein